jgi:hypothetical protein
VFERTRPVVVTADPHKAIVAAVLLERVASGEMDASVALNQWPHGAGPDELLDASLERPLLCGLTDSPNDRTRQALWACL